MATDSSLPEGTDTIITGASGEETAPVGDVTSNRRPAVPGNTSADGGAGTAAGTAASLKDAATQQAAGLKDQATDKAREFALMGKDRATDMLDQVARMVQDAAGTVDEKLGGPYADYARRAADAVTGVADGLRAKDVDELVNDAKELVRASPAIAIGAAAAIGFALSRVARAAVPEPEAPQAQKIDIDAAPAADGGTVSTRGQAGSGATAGGGLHSAVTGEG